MLKSKVCYQVRLPEFEGPLDLLLFLIKNKELKIEAVSISLITHDFIQFVEEYKQFGHTYIAEFINMAATLLYIKSNSFLPTQDNVFLEEDMEDPRKALVYQLIEYQKATQIVQFLQNKKNSYFLVKKQNTRLEEIKTRVNFTELSFKSLIDCYLKYFTPPKLDIITGKLIKIISTVEDKIKWLGSLLKKRLSISFFEIVKELNNQEMIVAFLASLEMTKQKAAVMHQEELFGDIIVESGDGLVDGEQEEIA